MNRRSFLVSSAAAASAARLSVAADIGTPASGPVVETASGRVRGFVHERVNGFKGIPYGASTEGANRFLPPQKRKAWTGVLDCIDLGPRSPQYGAPEIPEVAASDTHETMSEDCLRLNVWTTSLNKNARRPVMVWLHGGGFASGSAGYIMYDGANLSRKQDVVVVGVNHRLNVMGYLLLADVGGEKYKEAANVGMLDIVAALEWVRDNIAQFGGDPNNVTIFGQSGGGGKVSALMGMPPAKGLFHRAIIQSGSMLRATPRERATQSAQALLTKAGLKTADELQQLPLAKLLEAAKGTQGLALSPVLDPKTLPAHPFDPAATELCANVPLLAGTVETEVTFFPNTPLEPMDDAALHAAVKQATRADDAKVNELIAIYRKGRPGIANTDLFLILSSDNGFRNGVLTEAEIKSAQKAPVYMYYFTWRSPVREGKLRTFHTLEIPFVFQNIDEQKSMTGFGEDRYLLADRMSAAWAAFARTGNPNNKLLPNWTPFKTDARATMIFNNECKLVNDPNKEERLALAALRRQG
jgi:para-nitrobenzyl esterase